MEKKKNFLNIFKKLKKSKFSFGRDGDMDWVIICFVAFFSFILVSLWSGYLFLQVSKEADVLDSPSEDSYSLIDQKSLKGILERYEKKKTEFNILKEKNLETRDPAGI